MKPYIIQNKEFIEFFGKLSPYKKQKLVPVLSKDQVNTISEVCKKILKRNLTSNPNVINRLRKSQQEIKTIALKAVPLYKKKQILQTRKGGAILSVLLPLAASVITSLLAK